MVLFIVVVKGFHIGKNPRNKMPFIELNGRTITDSAVIIKQVSQYFGISLTITSNISFSISTILIAKKNNIYFDSLFRVCEFLNSFLMQCYFAGKDIDADLTLQEAAISHAVIHMLEDHFNWTMVYFR